MSAPIRRVTFAGISEGELPRVLDEWSRDVAEALEALSGALTTPRLEPVSARGGDTLRLWQVAMVDAQKGAATVYLPRPQRGGLAGVVNTSSSTNTITVRSSGGEDVGGSSTYSMTSAHEGRLFFADGAGWWPLGG